MSENKIKESDDADDEIYYKSPLKSKSRWGWGWFLLLGGYANWYNKAPVQPSLFTNILGLVTLFISYYWLRTRMTGMFSKLWKVSFVAGIIASFMSGLVTAILMKLGI
ncbi:MAG: hypothetical protein AUJ60_09050 [Nitrospirae bacterium CG1_02_44_142]|nr:MAG: hypothetical protein AUJ60_09050 [Nitrospirae bacterium CG1_02_44_142]